MDKYIGRLLDNRYEILEVLGTGGMAVVYKARCHRLNRLVAVKILKDDYLQDEEFRRRFHSESQAVAMLSHPNIVSIYDVSTSATADYIVMELIDGITLKQYMEKKGVLNWKETLHFAIQIGKALEHAHSRGIVHRDIKPHNVMVLKNGSVKVTDFGIARLMSQSNTLTKEALGSVHYISPEQAKGGRVDSRSDIYSLGVVMYEMMSGRPPYDGESPVAVAIKHINGGAPMPSTLNPNIPGGLEQVIMRAMALEPGDRYESATQMLRDMDEFRKDPGMLFDYNTPPLEDVIRIQKPPLVLDPTPPRTTAEKIEQKKHPAPAGNGAPKRRAPAAAAGTAAGAARPRQNRTREETHSNVATIAIIACSAVMVLAIVIFLVVLSTSGGSKKADPVRVPNLIGQDYETVKAQYGDQFKIKLNNKVFSSEYPAGQIVWQNPEENDEMVPNTPNSIIAVDVSMGEEPEPVLMPDILGQELSEAERALNNLGITLDIKVVREHHDDIPKDCVISTTPVAQTELTANQEVTVVVSDGVAFKTEEMPELCGKTKEDAKKILEDKKMNLEIVFEEKPNSDYPAGQVCETNPRKGEPISTNDSVTIYISTGPNMVPMSAVLNLSVDIAKSILASDGFVNYTIETVEDMKPKDTVIELRVDGEVVNPGVPVDTEKTVTIVVSLGPNLPQEVTKNVVIDLRGAADAGPCHVRITCNNQVVFDQEVAQGTTQITLEGQIGSGTLTYYIIIDEADGWTHEEAFS